MEIRKLKLPDDLDDLASVTLASFQYPENPDWSVQQDEVEELKDTIQAIRRYWPLIRIAMVFSPTVRYLLQGYVCGENENLVGTLMYQRWKGSKSDYYISNVAVHPDQRRRGIGRLLVQAALAEIKAQGGRKVILDVIAGNLPAYRLYERLGWVHFSGNVHLVREGEPPESFSVPDGFEVLEVPASDWGTDFHFAQRVVPQSVQQYDPIEEERFKESWLMRRLERLTGVRTGRLALRHSAEGRVVAMCGYRCRTRPGGSNHARLLVDPVHSPVAPFFVDYVTRWLQGQAPGRKIELVTPSWQRDVVAAAQDQGYTLRYEYHTMGLYLEEK